MAEEFLIIVVIVVCKRRWRGKEPQAAPRVRLERRKHLERRRFTPHDQGIGLPTKPRSLPGANILSVFCLYSLLSPSSSVSVAVFLSLVYLFLLFLSFSPYPYFSSQRSSFVALFVLHCQSCFWACLVTCRYKRLYIFFLYNSCRFCQCVSIANHTSFSLRIGRLIFYARLDQP